MKGTAVKEKNEQYEQVIVIRSDLEMSNGKLEAEATRASLMSFFEAEKSNEEIAQKWLGSGEKKIVLKASEDALKKLYAALQNKKVPAALVTDAGLTELPPGTVIALGIGPWLSSEIDKFTRALRCPTIGY